MWDSVYFLPVNIRLCHTMLKVSSSFRAYIFSGENLPNRPEVSFVVIFANLVTSFPYRLLETHGVTFVNIVLFKLEEHLFVSIVGLRDISKFFFLSSEDN